MYYSAYTIIMVNTSRCCWIASGPNVSCYLYSVAADAKSAISAAQDAACCESAALHNPAFLAFLKTAQEWIDSYIRSNTTVKNLDDEQL